jgi:hypothetical protein
MERFNGEVRDREKVRREKEGIRAPFTVNENEIITNCT